MENQEQNRDENLEQRANAGGFSSGSLETVSNDADNDDMDDDAATNEESAADDELDEDL